MSLLCKRHDHQAISLFLTQKVLCHPQVRVMASHLHTVLPFACLHYAQQTDARKLSSECLRNICKTDTCSFAILAPSHTSRDAQARRLDVRVMISTQKASQFDASHSAAGSFNNSRLRQRNVVCRAADHITSCKEGTAGWAAGLWMGCIGCPHGT